MCQGGKFRGSHIGCKVYGSKFMVSGLVYRMNFGFDSELKPSREP